MSTLIETLKLIEKQPGMYFGDPQRARSIQAIQSFILGLQTAQHGTNSQSDFDCFTEWVGARYHVLADGMGGFDMILNHVGGDQGKAFDEFFRLLPDYMSERQKIGRDAIISRFCEVQDECMEEFRKEIQK
jgi:hypothetical protein